MANRARVGAVVWTLALVIAMLMPASGGPSSPAGLDKLVHVLGFAVLAALWIAALPTTFATTPGVFLGCTLLGVVTEVLQGHLPWPRTPEALDAVANGIGVVLGVAVSVVVGRNGRDSNPR